jgi:LEA14-like dessication related protein
MNLFEQRYGLTLRVQNPNPEELAVSGVDFRLSLNGETFADGVSNQSARIPAYGDALLEVDVSSSLLRVFDQIRALEQGASDGLRYRIEGTLAVGEGWSRLPFEREGVVRLSPPDPSRAL